MKLEPKLYNGKYYVEFLGNKYQVEPGQTTANVDGVIFQVGEFPAVKIDVDYKEKTEPVEVKTPAKKKSTKKRKK